LRFIFGSNHSIRGGTKAVQRDIWLIEGELMVECGEQQGREQEFGQKNRGRKIRRGMKGTG